jgi:hypothetical protein
MHKIRFAAFLGKNHQIYNSGAIHDLSVVPLNVDIEADGFLCDDGEFITREQATQELHEDHPVQSEELIKAQRMPDMPKLGVEYRPQTPEVGPQEAQTKQKLMFNAAQHAGKKVSFPQAVAPGRRIAGQTGPGGTGTAISYAGKSPFIGVQEHENVHAMLSRVQDKHGSNARITLASNLYNSIPKEHRDAMRQYVNHIYGGKEPPSSRWHEEHLAHLVTYLNHPEQRMVFHRNKGTWDKNLNGMTEAGKGFDIKMKQAHRHLQEAAGKANKKWLNTLIHKSEIELIHKSMEWCPSESEIELALDMLHAFHDELPEFKAAKFMAKGYQPSQEEIEAALTEHDGDYETAALTAFKLEINDENIRTLRKMAYLHIKQDELSKAEQDVAIIPRIVKPFNDHAVQVANIVREAFENNQVHEIKLKGKHSRGTAIVKDENTGTLWLLKPGSGSESPALGITEEKADQSTRECAFNDCARLLGLGQYVPQSALLILDGQKIAALQFFRPLYKPVEKLKKTHMVELREAFQRATLNGLIYKWAAADYILGNVDRHAGNLLINEGWDIRFIDAGSTFAGPSYNPSKDTKSHVPYYLRVFSDRKFSVLTPDEKFNIIPTISEESDKALSMWLNYLPEGRIVATLNEYGINPQYVIDRIKALKSYPGPKSEFLRKFFSGKLESLS